MSFTPNTARHEPRWISNPHGVGGSSFCAECGRNRDAYSSLHELPAGSPFAKAVASAFAR